jgi:hypothetical protein
MPLLIATNIPFGNFSPRFMDVASAPSHSMVEVGNSAIF